jgi:hypothetical protein
MPLFDYMPLFSFDLDSFKSTSIIYDYIFFANTPIGDEDGYLLGNDQYRSQILSDGTICSKTMDEHMFLPYNKSLHEANYFSSEILYPTSSKHCSEMLNHMESHNALHHVGDAVERDSALYLTEEEKEGILKAIDKRE